jgi:hypothetical protein
MKRIDPAATHVQVAAVGDRGAPARELARRQSGAVEVLLLWRSALDQVEVCVRDAATGGGFRIEVAPGDAMEAFHHPYAYAVRPRELSR